MSFKKSLMILGMVTQLGCLKVGDSYTQYTGQSDDLSTALNLLKCSQCDNVKLEDIQSYTEHVLQGTKAEFNLASLRSAKAWLFYTDRTINRPLGTPAFELEDNEIRMFKIQRTNVDSSGKVLAKVQLGNVTKKYVGFLIILDASRQVYATRLIPGTAHRTRCETGMPPLSSDELKDVFANTFHAYATTSGKYAGSAHKCATCHTQAGPFPGLLPHSDPDIQTAYISLRDASLRYIDDLVSNTNDVTQSLLYQRAISSSGGSFPFHACNSTGICGPQFSDTIREELEEWAKCEAHSR